MVNILLKRGPNVRDVEFHIANILVYIHISFIPKENMVFDKDADTLELDMGKDQG